MPVTVIPGGLAGLLWEVFLGPAEDGFLQILRSCKSLIFLGWKGANGGNVSKALSCKLNSYFISHHMRDTKKGASCVRGCHNPSYPTNGKKETCYMWQHGPIRLRRLWLFLFFFFRTGALCSQEHAQSQGCFAVDALLVGIPNYYQFADCLECLIKIPAEWLIIIKKLITNQPWQLTLASLFAYIW